MLVLYKLRALILQDLRVPPSLPALAAQAGMSESKLKRLFKQVFGQSIYQYYQRFRLQQAARMIREQQLSITEVGYSLGFTNLGHFAKVFEQQFGITPKKYAMQS